MSELTYRKSGVDIDEGERFVRLISPTVKKTFRPEVLTDIGSFGALFRLDTEKYREPILVSGTDGVGTKLKVAFKAGRHDTVGIDLVAMCVNDILTSGAEPLFFLDYFATGKLRAEDASRVVEGIARGCQEAGCALVGGETAEMPGFYSKDEYDLSGFAVGVVEREALIDGSGVREGDAVIGLSSSGLHSNGYSLVRKLFFEQEKMDCSAEVPELGTSLCDELLKPTRIYVKAFQSLREKVEVRAMAHVTGGGLSGNLPRVLPGGMRAEVERGAWPVQPIFTLIRKLGNVPEEDMEKTFNMGIGFIIVVDRENAEKTLDILGENDYDSYVIGHLAQGDGGLKYV
jgi:phosphoribosylformylglycinamidine cyclo-ligase